MNETMENWPSDPSEQAILRRFQDDEGRLKQWPAKRSYQLIALRWLISHFETGQRWTQKEVNAKIQELHGFADWVFLRRELIDARLLDRTRDGAAYWRPADGSEL